MQGHDRDAILALVPSVHVAGKRDRLQPITEGALAVFRGELLGRGDKLFDIRQPLLIIGIATDLKHAAVAAAVQHLTNHLVRRSSGELGKLMKELSESAESGSRLVLDGG